MIDELQELRSANPYQPEQLAAGVSVPRDDLIAALRHDASRFPFVFASQGAAPARVRWIGAMAAAVLAVVGLASWGVSGEGDQIEVDVAEVPTTMDGAGPSTTVFDAVATTAGNDEPAPVDTPPLPTEPPAPAPTSTASPTETPPTTGATPPTTTAGSSPVPTSGPSTTAGSDPVGSTTTIPSEAAVDGAFTPGVDLMVIHLDFGHTDDGQSAIASREVAAAFGIDPLVVAGVASPSADFFVHSYEQIMTSAWGSGWVDAANRSTAVDQATARWLVTLDAGGEVWVAEGGVSDFSAEVLRTVQAARPSLDTTTRVHVVQHAQRNEAETKVADLSFVTTNAIYVNIDDGNNVNGTAGLKGSSSGFESVALTGPTAAAWAAGFEFHDDDIDFSDTVAVLHLVGVDTDEVADIDDFAARFMDRS